jgi:tetratricopeptide (TPR) repeat protein
MPAHAAPMGSFGVPCEWHFGVPGLIVALAAIMLYVPTVRYGFVGWDDTRYIVENPLMTRPGGFFALWTSGEPDQYYPLTFSLYWIEHRLWDGWAGGYHATNVVLHAANALLLLGLLRRWGLGRGPACFVSLAFVVHPVQVMSVAWVAERKNLLSCLFTLAALLYWTRYRQERRTLWYAASFLAFLFALLSKTAVLTLPIVLLALDRLAWRIPWRTSLRAVALFTVPIAAAAAVTVQFEREFLGPMPDGYARLPAAPAAVWFYAKQLVVPLPLMPIHPMWSPSIRSVAWWLPAISLVATMAVFWRFRTRIAGEILFGSIHFLAFLIPILGFVSYGNLALTFVSDHYLYLPSIGFFLVVAVGLARLGENIPAVSAWVTAGSPALLLAAFAASWGYMPVFTDGESLWGRTLATNPTCPAAHAGLGRVFEHRGDWATALSHYQRSAQQGLYDEAPLDVARALRHLNRWEEAEAVLLLAHQRSPRSTALLVELARMAQRTKRFEESIRHYETALAAEPNDAMLHQELGTLYLGLLRRSDAERHFAEAVRLEPRQARAWLGWATSLRGQERFAEALRRLDEALRATPENVPLLNLAARILATAPDASVRDGARAVQLARRAEQETQSRNHEVLDTLAAAYAESGRWAEAEETAERAVQRAEAAGERLFADAIRARQELYRRREALREITTWVPQEPRE